MLSKELINEKNEEFFKICLPKHSPLFRRIGAFFVGWNSLRHISHPHNARTLYMGQLARTPPGAVNDASNPIASQDPAL